MIELKNLKQIKNRDEFIKVCEMNYINGMLKLIKRPERVELILPTEIITKNLENRFIDFRIKTKDSKILIIEGESDKLRIDDTPRFYKYFIQTKCKYETAVEFLLISLAEDNIHIGGWVEENIYFKVEVYELKKMDGELKLSTLKTKLKNNEPLDEEDYATLINIPNMSLKRSEEVVVFEICDLIIKYKENIPQKDLDKISTAMCLNIIYYVEKEADQEYLIGEIDMIEHCTNELDRQLNRAENRGWKDGKKIGIKEGEEKELARTIRHMSKTRSDIQIAQIIGKNVKEVIQIKRKYHI